MTYMSEFKTSNLLSIIQICDIASAKGGSSKIFMFYGGPGCQKSCLPLPYDVNEIINGKIF